MEVTHGVKKTGGGRKKGRWGTRKRMRKIKRWRNRMIQEHMDVKKEAEAVLIKNRRRK